MKKIDSPDSNTGEKSNFKHIEAGRSSRRPWFFAAGGALVILIALVWPRPGNEVPNQADSTDSAVLRTTSNSLSGGRAQLWPTSQRPGPSATAEEIVAGKVSQFGRSRREIVRAIARRSPKDVPPEVEAFFDAIESGHWEEIKARWDAMSKRSGQYEGSTHSPELDPF